MNYVSSDDDFGPEPWSWRSRLRWWFHRVILRRKSADWAEPAIKLLPGSTTVRLWTHGDFIKHYGHAPGDVERARQMLGSQPYKISDTYDARRPTFHVTHISPAAIGPQQQAWLDACLAEDDPDKR